MDIILLYWSASSSILHIAREYVALTVIVYSRITSDIMLCWSAFYSIFHVIIRDNHHENFIPEYHKVFRVYIVPAIIYWQYPLHTTTHAKQTYLRNKPHMYHYFDITFFSHPYPYINWMISKATATTKISLRLKFSAGCTKMLLCVTLSVLDNWKESKMFLNLSILLNFRNYFFNVSCITALSKDLFVSLKTISNNTYSVRNKVNR